MLHLLSLISPLDDDLAVVYLPLMPVRLVELLERRGVKLVSVPDEEFETMGPNVLALGPRVGLALEGNDRRANGWSASASRCSSTAATRSRGRATAARPA